MVVSRALVLIAALSSSMAGIACTLFTDLSGASKGSGGSPASDGDSGGGGKLDGGNSDSGGPKANACGAPIFGSPVAITNGDLELGCTTGGWHTYAAATTEDPRAPANGSYACRVCTTQTLANQSSTFSITVPIQADAGSTFEMVGCVRAAAESTPPSHIRAIIGNAGGQARAVTGSYEAVRGSWTAAGGEATLTVGFATQAIEGTCYVVDDVRLFRVLP